MATDVVYQGTLHKLGGNVKSWTKRWMILKKDNVLYYYKDPAKAPQGSIPLVDHMFLAKEGRERDLNWPKSVGIERTIVIRTSYRIYYMYAETQQEAAKWIEHLQSVAENIPGRKVYKRAEPKPTLPSEASSSGKSYRPNTASVSSNISEGTVDSIYDAANHPDSDSGSSEENSQQLNSDYAVPPSGELAGDDDVIYELADDNPTHSNPSRTPSSKSLTTPAPLPTHAANTSSGGNLPIYEDADAVTAPPEEVYEVVNDQQPAWAASRHLPPSDPPPPPPDDDDDDDDDDDEDTVPLPQPPLPPKDSKGPPPIPNRRSSSKVTGGDDDSPPAVPLKKKAAASSPKATHVNGDDDHYSLLDKIEKPTLSTSPPTLMQKSRIDSLKKVTGTISPTEIDSLNYEPAEDSEEFYIDMTATDEAMNEDQLQLEYQRQKELEAEQQRQLEAQKQKQLEEERQKELEKQRQKKLEAQREKERRQAEAEIQRQREMEQEFDNVTIQQYNGTKQLSQIELEAQRQAEYEARMRREMEDKKKERSDYLASKSKGKPAQLAVQGADAKKKRSGTNMFKAQRDRLVESVGTEQATSNGKPTTGAWLEIEREKTLMQEEKLKLERQKQQLEEERQQFEREKRRMQMEMARLKQ